MSESTRFWFRFSGSALDGGTMDAYELGASITALGTLVEEASRIALGEGKNISLKVRADFQRGSFEVLFELQQNLVRQFVDLFNSQPINATLAVLSLLGVNGMPGFLALLKKLKGKPPAKVTRVTRTDTVVIEVETADGQTMEVAEKVMEMLDSAPARKAAERLVAPLKQPGIDRVDFGQLDGQGQPVGILIEKEEVPYFDQPAKSGESEHTTEIFVSILTLSLVPDYQWRVSTGEGGPFYVDIVDEDFWDKVRSGGVSFKHGDHLRVMMHTRQYYELGVLKAKCRILKVLTHLPAPVQGELDLRRVGPAAEQN